MPPKIRKRVRVSKKDPKDKTKQQDIRNYMKPKAVEVQGITFPGAEKLRSTVNPVYKSMPGMKKDNEKVKSNIYDNAADDRIDKTNLRRKKQKRKIPNPKKVTGRK